ncbi:hypothetical protein F4813DRAFT_96001 [Daldinia decipiens]|uniref:uncharacterized protein n=1 Tax=Daldinia decipiens TaxID=326647 RepID=UPI0020C23E88|nr:uncharacterized protein F4813DRAFT_96001 [Daldinia decipiens]KAI1662010.1 hypothetical protein F4813DRAFT_96001 [Daldinia decipiens]
MIQRNFEATESQYRTQFKKWGPKWIKNSKVEDTEMLSILIHQRKSNGKESNVFEWGKLLDKGEVKKRVAKSTPNTLRRLELIGNHQKLPAQFVVRTPMEDCTFSFTHDLPFFQFERSICDRMSTSDLAPNVMANAQLLTDQQKTPANALILRQKSIEDISQYYSSRGEIFFTTNTTALNTLNCIIPCTIHQTTILGPPLYRQILHSAGNNFSGLSSFPVEQILQILRETTSTDLYSLILSPSRHSSRYSARSIAQSLLKGAIETGDSATATAILSNKSLAINVNQQICFFETDKYTLIERASMLNHKNVIKALLDNGADVNKTYHCLQCDVYPQQFRCNSHGALECVLRRDYEFGVDVEVIQMLLRAGSFVDLATVGELLRLRQDDIACQIVSKNLLLIGNGLVRQLRHAIGCIDDDIQVRLLHILHRNGIDLTHKDIFMTVIQARIQARSFETRWELAETLLDYGAIPDKTILRCLIRGDIYSYEFTEDISGASPTECIQTLKTPGKMAVQNKLRSNSDVLAYQESPRHLDEMCTRWIAAVDKIDTGLIIELIKELKKLNIPFTTFKFLYHALMEVSRIGDYEAARMVLGHITQLGLPIGDQVFQDALSEAIRGGNESLVQLILGFDYDPFSAVL